MHAFLKRVTLSSTASKKPSPPPPRETGQRPAPRPLAATPRTMASASPAISDLSSNSPTRIVSDKDTSASHRPQEAGQSTTTATPSATVKLSPCPSPPLPPLMEANTGNCHGLRLAKPTTTTNFARGLDASSLPSTTTTTPRPTHSEEKVSGKPSPVDTGKLSASTSPGYSVTPFTASSAPGRETPSKPDTTANAGVSLASSFTTTSTHAATGTLGGLPMLNSTSSLPIVSDGEGGAVGTAVPGTHPLGLLHSPAFVDRPLQTTTFPRSPSIPSAVHNPLIADLLGDLGSATTELIITKGTNGNGNSKTTAPASAKTGGGKDSNTNSNNNATSRNGGGGGGSGTRLCPSKGNCPLALPAAAMSRTRSVKGGSERCFSSNAKNVNRHESDPFEPSDGKSSDGTQKNNSQLLLENYYAQHGLSTNTNTNTANSTSAASPTAAGATGRVRPADTSITSTPSGGNNTTSNSNISNGGGGGAALLLKRLVPARPPSPTHTPLKAAMLERCTSGVANTSCISISNYSVRDVRQSTVGPGASTSSGAASDPAMAIAMNAIKHASQSFVHTLRMHDMDCFFQTCSPSLSENAAAAAAVHSPEGSSSTGVSPEAAAAASTANDTGYWREQNVKVALGKKSGQEVASLVIDLLDILEEVRLSRGRVQLRSGGGGGSSYTTDGEVTVATDGRVGSVSSLTGLAGESGELGTSMHSTMSTASIMRPPVHETHTIRLKYDPLEKKKIINNYLILANLGKGSYGKVKLGDDLITKRKVAIKIIDKKHLQKKFGGIGSRSLALGDDDTDTDSNRPGKVGVGGAAAAALKHHRSPSPGQEDNALKREIAIMKKVHHRNCVALFEVIDDPLSQKLYLIMDYIPNGPVVKLKQSKIPIELLKSVEGGPASGSEMPYNRYLIRCCVRQQLAAERGLRGGGTGATLTSSKTTVSGLSAGGGSLSSSKDGASGGASPESPASPATQTSVLGIIAVDGDAPLTQRELAGSCAVAASSSTKLPPTAAASPQLQPSSSSNNRFSTAAEFFLFSCKPVREEIVFVYLRQLVSGLSYLHRKRVVHHDIKPDNILLGVNNHVYLTDFGVSEIFEKGTGKAKPKVRKVRSASSKTNSAKKNSSGLDDGEKDGAGGGSDDDKEEDDRGGDPVTGPRFGAGTLLFTAPELFASDEAGLQHLNPFLTDVWALGVTIYCILMGVSPFNGKSYRQISHNIKHLHFPFNGYNFENKPIQPEWATVFKGVLEKDPKKRWSLRQLRHYLDTNEAMKALHANGAAFTLGSNGGGDGGGVDVGALSSPITRSLTGTVKAPHTTAIEVPPSAPATAAAAAVGTCGDSLSAVVVPSISSTSYGAATSSTTSSATSAATSPATSPASTPPPATVHGPEDALPLPLTHRSVCDGVGGAGGGGVSGFITPVKGSPNTEEKGRPQVSAARSSNSIPASTIETNAYSGDNSRHPGTHYSQLSSDDLDTSKSTSLAGSCYGQTAAERVQDLSPSEIENATRCEKVEVLTVFQKRLVISEAAAEVVSAFVGRARFRVNQRKKNAALLVPTADIERQRQQQEAFIKVSARCSSNPGGSGGGTGSVATDALTHTLNRHRAVNGSSIGHCTALNTNGDNSSSDCSCSPLRYGGHRASLRVGRFPDPYLPDSSDEDVDYDVFSMQSNRGDSNADALLTALESERSVNGEVSVLDTTGTFQRVQAGCEVFYVPTIAAVPNAMRDLSARTSRSLPSMAASDSRRISVSTAPHEQERQRTGHLGAAATTTTRTTVAHNNTAELPLVTLSAGATQTSALPHPNSQHTSSNSTTNSTAATTMTTTGTGRSNNRNSNHNYSSTHTLDNTTNGVRHASVPILTAPTLIATNALVPVISTAATNSSTNSNEPAALGAPSAAAAPAPGVTRRPGSPRELGNLCGDLQHMNIVELDAMLSIVNLGSSIDGNTGSFSFSSSLTYTRDVELSRSKSRGTSQGSFTTPTMAAAAAANARANCHPNTHSPSSSGKATPISHHVSCKGDHPSNSGSVYSGVSGRGDSGRGGGVKRCQHRQPTTAAPPGPNYDHRGSPYGSTDSNGRSSEVVSPFGHPAGPYHRMAGVDNDAHARLLGSQPSHYLLLSSDSQPGTPVLTSCATPEPEFASAAHPRVPNVAELQRLLTDLSSSLSPTDRDTPQRPLPRTAATATALTSGDSSPMARTAKRSCAHQHNNDPMLSPSNGGGSSSDSSIGDSSSTIGPTSTSGVALGGRDKRLHLFNEKGRKTVKMRTMPYAQMRTRCSGGVTPSPHKNTRSKEDNEEEEREEEDTASSPCSQRTPTAPGPMPASCVVHGPPAPPLLRSSHEQSLPPTAPHLIGKGIQLTPTEPQLVLRRTSHTTTATMDDLHSSSFSTVDCLTTTQCPSTVIGSSQLSPTVTRYPHVYTSNETPAGSAAPLQRSSGPDRAAQHSSDRTADKTSAVASDISGTVSSVTGWSPPEERRPQQPPLRPPYDASSFGTADTVSEYATITQTLTTTTASTSSTNTSAELQRILFHTAGRPKRCQPIANCSPKPTATEAASLLPLSDRTEPSSSSGVALRIPSVGLPPATSTTAANTGNNTNSHNSGGALRKTVPAILCKAGRNNDGDALRPLQTGHADTAQPSESRPTTANATTVPTPWPAATGARPEKDVTFPGLSPGFLCDATCTDDNGESDGTDNCRTSHLSRQTHGSLPNAHGSTVGSGGSGGGGGEGDADTAMRSLAVSGGHQRRPNAHRLPTLNRSRNHSSADSHTPKKESSPIHPFAATLKGNDGGGGGGDGASRKTRGADHSDSRGAVIIKDDDTGVSRVGKTRFSGMSPPIRLPPVLHAWEEVSEGTLKSSIPVSKRV